MGKRIFYLDNLRMAMIIMAVLYSSAMGFMVFTPQHTYVINQGPNIVFDCFVQWCDALILPILFFISGYFAASSLRIRLFKPFFKEKWQRIGIPWLFGSLIVAPELAYLSFLNLHTDANFLTFYGYHFWQDSFEQGPFGFLGVLAFFYVLLMAAKKVRPHCLQRNEAAPPSILCMLLLIGCSTTGMFFVLPHIGNRWIQVLYVLNFQPSQIINCSLYFLFGIYAFKHRWFTAQGYCPSCRWVLPFIVLSVVYISLFLPFGMSTVVTIFPLVRALTVALLSVCALLGLLGSFAAWGNKPLALTALSYPIYFLGQALVLNTAWFLQPLEISSFLKFLLISGLSLIYAYMLGKYALIRMRPFKPRH